MRNPHDYYGSKETFLGKVSDWLQDNPDGNLLTRRIQPIASALLALDKVNISGSNNNGLELGFDFPFKAVDQPPSKHWANVMGVALRNTMLENTNGESFVTLDHSNNFNVDGIRSTFFCSFIIGETQNHIDDPVTYARAALVVGSSISKLPETYVLAGRHQPVDTAITNPGSNLTIQG